MFAVWLWHLFEQQLADFVRHAILDYPKDMTENPDLAYRVNSERYNMS
jgi:hypothetical protein